VTEIHNNNYLLIPFFTWISFRWWKIYQTDPDDGNRWESCSNRLESTMCFKSNCFFI